MTPKWRAADDESSVGDVDGKELYSSKPIYLWVLYYYYIIMRTALQYIRDIYNIWKFENTISLHCTSSHCVSTISIPQHVNGPRPTSSFQIREMSTCNHRAPRPWLLLTAPWFGWIKVVIVIGLSPPSLLRFGGEREKEEEGIPRKERRDAMGLISGMFLGIILGIALIAGWKHMMSYRSAKRIGKVWIANIFHFFTLISSHFFF